MTELYDLAKAVYAGDLLAAQATLDKMRTTSFEVLRAKLVAGTASATAKVPVDTEVQRRLDALMAPDEATLFAQSRPHHYRVIRPRTGAK